MQTLPDWFLPLFFGSATLAAFAWWALREHAASQRNHIPYRHENGPFDL